MYIFIINDYTKMYNEKKNVLEIVNFYLEFTKKLPTKFLFRQMEISIDNIFSKFQVFKFTWEMRNVLKEWNIIFPIFSFWDMIVFVPIFRWFLSTKSTITQKLKIAKIGKFKKLWKLWTKLTIIQKIKL